MGMKIERPDWLGMLKHRAMDSEILNAWFNAYVSPINKLLSEGVEVYMPSNSTVWGITASKTFKDTHKALLINIQPIKKESAEV